LELALPKTCLNLLAPLLNRLELLVLVDDRFSRFTL